MTTCLDIYGFVVEKTLNINQTICGQDTRESVIYRSKSNTVEIYLKKTRGINFFVTYTANGCSDPVPPLHAWYKRNGNEAVIGCENSDREWRLTNRKEKKYNKEYLNKREQFSGALTEPSQYRLVSTTGTEGQDEYLQPNTNTQSHKPPCKPEEPLIHIWETPLPNPTADQTIPRHNECTIHRNNGNKPNIQNPSLTKKGTIRSGTSYYSPNTGHKYYVVDRDK
ncbi:hypothetical protein LSH36_200g02300 [Paralvinella palmiformis]|uniref:Uncharacterized protein n=1 Tax=Paralvinella palmiformis TaxID=53620 RepID=A0AAD9JPY4_9ANNE|nr:hypothetical protein LSH36_200g02300 [Paralvinella palmiformis]